MFIKVRKLVSMRVAGYRSIDPSPPNVMIKAAKDIHLAAFFFGKSATYFAVAYKDIY